MTRSTKNISSNSESRRMAANMKERVRVQKMNKAFVDLKKVLPKTTTATKMDLLSSAKEHIQYLTDVLQESFGKDIQYILNGHKLRKVFDMKIKQFSSFQKEKVTNCPIHSPESIFPIQGKIIPRSNSVNHGSVTECTYQKHKNNQLMPHDDYFDKIFNFSIKSPESSISEENTISSPNSLNYGNVALSKSENYRENQMLPHEDPSETNIDFPVRTPATTIPFQVKNPESTNPFHDEIITTPKYLMHPGMVADDLKLILGPTTCQENTQARAIQQCSIQEFCNPEYSTLLQHKVTNAENIIMNSNNNNNTTCVWQGIPNPVCGISLDNSQVIPDIKQSNSTEIIKEVSKPTLADEMDQFYCEMFGIDLFDL